MCNFSFCPVNTQILRQTTPTKENTKKDQPVDRTAPTTIMMDFRLYPYLTHPYIFTITDFNLLYTTYHNTIAYDIVCQCNKHGTISDEPLLE